MAFKPHEVLLSCAFFWTAVAFWYFAQVNSLILGGVVLLLNHFYCDASSALRITARTIWRDLT